MYTSPADCKLQLRLIVNLRCQDCEERAGAPDRPALRDARAPRRTDNRLWLASGAVGRISWAAGDGHRWRLVPTYVLL